MGTENIEQEKQLAAAGQAGGNPSKIWEKLLPYLNKFVVDPANYLAKGYNKTMSWLPGEVTGRPPGPRNATEAEIDRKARELQKATYYTSTQVEEAIKKIEKRNRNE